MQLEAHPTPRITRCFTSRLTLSPGNQIPVKKVGKKKRQRFPKLPPALPKSFTQPCCFSLLGVSPCGCFSLGFCYFCYPLLIVLFWFFPFWFFSPKARSNAPTSQRPKALRPHALWFFPCGVPLLVFSPLGFFLFSVSPLGFSPFALLLICPSSLLLQGCQPLKPVG